ncbi:DUF484 family protein [Candidatus Thiosymbion oneisti]|uniref:DUF484 family protein n=1 Tax=Candidatus Thiosymbion oneisti TaxID=589554 RepID=UPI000B7D8204|nr:DUF484 family protein [Candidatus Thiosymbion oneisti]
MTTRRVEEDRGPAEIIAEDAVAEYLAAHPEFFERHPDLVAELRVPHAAGQAVSLIEHQVGVLRGQLRTERRRLVQLIARARNFEALSVRLHDLSLRLIAAQDPEQVEAVLREALCRQFDTEAVTLKLFPLESDDSDSDPKVAAFIQFLDRERSLCGPLDPEHNGILFGEQGGAIGSAALIPIRMDGRSGVLAIGSHDRGRFGTDMGTDLLDRLGEIVSQKLRTLHRIDG